MADDLARLDATAQADLVRRREVSPRDLVDAAIARIERLNPTLNAVIHPLFDKARAQVANGALPDGPFHGVPLLVKDLLCHTAGDPYHLGARPLRDAGFTAPHDAYLTQKFRAAGFVIVGRTNTPELGILPTTEPEAYGPTRNPWDTSRSTGGSSGGSAAAVAAGLVPAAHANDGGGSIRIPASACGLVGLKPSRCRTSLGPEIGDLLMGLGVEGVVTRSVRDTAAILDAIAGAMPGDPYPAPPPVRPYRQEVGADPGRLRIGILTRPPLELFQTHPDCVAPTLETGRLLESLGHHVEPAHPAVLDDPEAGQHFSVIFCAHIAHLLDMVLEVTGRRPGPEDLEPLSWEMAELGRSCSASAFMTTVDWVHGYGRRVASWWGSGFDLLLTPTLPEPPLPLGTFGRSAGDGMAVGLRASQFACFTWPFNLTGQPAISLPISSNAAGLPIGVQLVAAYGREDLLLRVAAQLETARPWRDRRPPGHA